MIRPGAAVGSALAVFAHPDDESLSSGGLLAGLSERGTRTAVVTATWAPGTRRVAELAEALRHLGAGEPRLLGYADARVPESAPGCPRLVDACVEDVVARLGVHIRELRPDVVVCHDAHGGLTGHPDHRRTHEATIRAVREAARSDQHPGAGERHRVDSVWLATHPHGARALVQGLVGTRRTVHTVPDKDAVVVDVGPWLPVKVAAVLAHRSEVDRGALPGVVAALSPQDRARLLGREWYQQHPPAARPG